MPSSPESGTTWHIEGSRVVVTGYASCLDRLNLGVAPFGHDLEIGERHVNLVEAIGPDRLAVLEIERIPLILIAMAEVRHW